MPDEEYKLQVNLYDYDLTLKNNLTISDIIEPFFGDGPYFKACILSEGYTGFIYFINGYRYTFEILYLKTENYTYEKKVEYNENDYTLNHLITLNEFLKIDEERMVFLSTNENRILYIIMFDLYNDYTFIKIRYYSILVSTEFSSMFSKELSGFIYNNYIAFTANLVPKGKDILSENFFPIFLIFSYVNGTDFEIDIYPYLSDTDDFTSSNNLIDDLLSKAEIDNNIFGYELVERIKLISIPEELLLFDSNNSPLLDNSELDKNYILKQNNEIILKTDDYYYLEYQFIAKEQNYNDFYQPGIYLLNSKYSGDIDHDLSTYFRPRYFYGRVNTLKFKLCHQYCKTCKTMGNPKSYSEQK